MGREKTFRRGNHLSQGTELEAPKMCWGRVMALTEGRRDEETRLKGRERPEWEEQECNSSSVAEVMF